MFYWRSLNYTASLSCSSGLPSVGKLPERFSESWFSILTAGFCGCSFFAGPVSSFPYFVSMIVLITSRLGMLYTFCRVATAWSLSMLFVSRFFIYCLKICPRLSGFPPVLSPTLEAFSNYEPSPFLAPEAALAVFTWARASNCSGWRISAGRGFKL